MIEFVKGDFFEYDADIRINTVNCVGVMGAGAALQFKNKYPDMFLDYKKACELKQVRPGVPHVWINQDFFDKTTIINFPTKDHWKNPSEYEYIKKGLVWLSNYLHDKNNSTVTLPALGCGNGGLDWDIVKDMIQKYLGNILAKIFVFEPNSSIQNFIPEHIQKTFNEKRIFIVSSNSHNYPQKIKGKSATEIYYKGNFSLTEKRNISIITNNNPTEREKKALNLFIDELDKSKFTIFLGLNTTTDSELAKDIILKGFRLVVFVSMGILQFKLKKELEDIFDFDNNLIISITKPENNWKSYEAINATKFRLKLSDNILINSLDIDFISSLEKDLNSNNSKKFYLNYWKTEIDIFKKINSNKIGINPNTMRPNLSILDI